MNNSTRRLDECFFRLVVHLSDIKAFQVKIWIHTNYLNGVFFCFEIAMVQIYLIRLKIIFNLLLLLFPFISRYKTNICRACHSYVRNI